MNSTRHYHIQVGGDSLDVDVDEEGAGSIQSSLKCGLGRNASDRRIAAMIDGVEATILAHACAGIDINTREYREGIEVVLEKIANMA